MKKFAEELEKKAEALDVLLESDWRDMLGKDQDNIATRLEQLISAWNGDSPEFIFEGEVYTEADVNQASEVLEALKSENDNN